MTVPPPSQPVPEDPHEGSEDDPRRELDARDADTVVPPRRYEPTAGAVEVSTSAPSTMERVTAASIPLATLSFFLIGFLTGLWWIAWVVFLVPPVLKAWTRPDRR